MSDRKDYTHGGNIYKASEELGIAQGKILDFSANINPLGLSPKGKKAILGNINRVLNYPDPEYRRLRLSLSSYYSVKQEHILLGNGAIELIYSFIKNQPKGRALIPAPGFVEYEKALKREGWDVEFYNSKDEIKTKGIDLIFICNPNNPTGSSYSYGFLIDLLDKCKADGTNLLIDEAFIEYSSYKTTTYEITTYNNLYILKSLTKFFAIPGLRLGALITSNKGFINKFNNQIIPWSINSVVEEYICSALEDYNYIKTSKKFIQKERLWLYRELNKIDNLKVFRSQGNYLLLKDKLGLDLANILKIKGLLIRDCSNYNNLDKSYFRVAVKKRSQNRVLLKELKSIYKGK